MKTCPSCKSIYADETLNYCLSDGSILEFQADGSIESPQFTNSPKELPPQVERINEEVPTRVLARAHEPSPANSVDENGTAAPSDSWAGAGFGKILVAMSIVTVLAFGAGGLLVYLLIGQNSDDEVQFNSESARENSNKLIVSDENSKSKIPTPTPRTPVPTPTLSYQETSEIRDEIDLKLDQFKEDSRKSDLNSLMENYAEIVSYYNKKRASQAFIRADKLRAYEKYDTIQSYFSNVQISPSPDGETATVLFDKEFELSNQDNGDFSSGKVQTELIYRRINGEWLIVSERDKKVYYVVN